MARNPVGTFFVSSIQPYLIFSLTYLFNSLFGVGNTHEDIDALFGVIRQHLRRKGTRWRTLAEFEALVRETLQGYPGNVRVELVTDVLDHKKRLIECVNPNLSLYSRHDDNLHPGMHVVRSALIMRVVPGFFRVVHFFFLLFQVRQVWRRRADGVPAAQQG